MTRAKKSAKPFWAMNKNELAEATREFDHEQSNGFEPLSPEKRAIWERISAETGIDIGPIRLRSAGDVKLVRDKIKLAAAALAKRLKKIANHAPFELLKDFKMDRLGYDPYEPDMEMNLVEQINQSATLLVACAAVARLSKKHPSKLGYVIARPTAKGYDVWAEDVSVAAEVFAATSPGSNRKIARDLDAVLGNAKIPFDNTSPPKCRYIFFVSRSLNGFPPASHPLSPGRDPILGNIWKTAEPGRGSVIVVPLSEKEVFSD